MKIPSRGPARRIVRGIQHLGQRWKDQGFSVELGQSTEQASVIKDSDTCTPTLCCQVARGIGERLMKESDYQLTDCGSRVQRGSYQECRAEKDTVTLEEERGEDLCGGQGSRCRARYRDSLKPTSL